ncbi:MAG: hypothetical protein IJ083_00450 [Clostridia bacterium]|nr:hypothetical protein [Clostridia bacterium]
MKIETREIGKDYAIREIEHLEDLFASERLRNVCREKSRQIHRELLGGQEFTLAEAAETKAEEALPQHLNRELGRLSAMTIPRYLFMPLLIILFEVLVFGLFENPSADAMAAVGIGAVLLVLFHEWLTAVRTSFRYRLWDRYCKVALSLLHIRPDQDSSLEKEMMQERNCRAAVMMLYRISRRTGLILFVSMSFVVQYLMRGFYEMSFWMFLVAVLSCILYYRAAYAANDALLTPFLEQEMKKAGFGDERR